MDELGRAWITAVRAAQEAETLTNEEVGARLGVSGNYWSKLKSYPPDRPVTISVVKDSRHGFATDMDVQRAAAAYIAEWLRTAPTEPRAVGAAND